MIITASQDHYAPGGWREPVQPSRANPWSQEHTRILSRAPGGRSFRFLPLSLLTLTTDILFFSHSFIQNYANACESRQVCGCVHRTLPLREACVCPGFSRSGWDSVNAGKEEVQGPTGRRDNSAEWSWARKGVWALGAA